MIKRILVFILAGLFSLLVSVGMFSTLLKLSIGDRQTMKNWLLESSIQENLVNRIVESATVINQSNIRAEILTETAEKSFTTDEINEWTTKLVDSSYDWLERKQPNIDFEIDYSKNKDKFLVDLETNAQLKYSTLPKCTDEQNLQLKDQVDVLELGCQSDLIDISKYTADMKNELLASDAFMSKTKIAMSELKIDNQPIDQKLSWLPNVWYRLHLLPIISFSFALFVAVLIVELSKPKTVGIRRVGSKLVITGIGWLLPRFVSLIIGNNSKIGSSLDSADKELLGRELVVPLVDKIITDMINLSSYIGLVSLIIGIAMLIIYRVIRKKQGNVSKIIDQTAGIEDNHKDSNQVWIDLDEDPSDDFVINESELPSAPTVTMSRTKSSLASYQPIHNHSTNRQNMISRPTRQRDSTVSPIKPQIVSQNVNLGNSMQSKTTKITIKTPLPNTKTNKPNNSQRKIQG